eukprot:jgi/Ulvmu1/128/UM001_0132.1
MINWGESANLQCQRTEPPSPSAARSPRSPTPARAPSGPAASLAATPSATPPSPRCAPLIVLLHPASDPHPCPPGVRAMLAPHSMPQPPHLCSRSTQHGALRHTNTSPPQALQVLDNGQHVCLLPP